MKDKMNKELKEYLYMLVGKELTRQDYEKILDYFNQLKQERDHYKNKSLNMIFELQERIDRALRFMDYTFDISTVQDMFTIMNRLEFILKGRDKE